MSVSAVRNRWLPSSCRSSIYTTLIALFVAQATNTDLSISQQIAILAVAMLTSKGVTGASFIALVGMLSVDYSGRRHAAHLLALIPYSTTST